MTAAADLILDVGRCGIELRAEGGRLPLAAIATTPSSLSMSGRITTGPAFPQTATCRVYGWSTSRPRSGQVKHSCIQNKHRVLWHGMANVLDRIRAAIRKSGVTRYRIAKETDIGQPQLSRLMKGECGLSIEALERLAEYLGLEIRIRPKRRKDR